MTTMPDRECSLEEQVEFLRKRIAELEQTLAQKERQESRLLNDIEFGETEKKLEKTEKRYRAVMQANPDPMVVYDMAGHVVFINPAFTQIFGWSLEELYGKKLDYFVPEENWPETIEGIKQVLAGKNISGLETCRFTKNGEKIPVNISGAIYKDSEGNSLGSVMNLRDISAVKQVENEYKKAKEAAEAANRAKSEFLANMSHEIRTPMNGIIGMTHLALSTGVTPEQREYLETVRKSADHLMGLVNDVLDFSKIEAGKLALEHFNFDLRLTVAEVKDIITPQALEKKLNLICRLEDEVPIKLCGDPGRLRQILQNLCSNAVKFTHHGEVIIDISLEHETQRHATIRFIVHDTGIGICADDIDKLFKSFSQVESGTTRKYGGTGLGLVICKKLAECMGGDIGVSSKTGIGSTFWFTAVLEKQAVDSNTPLAQDSDIRDKHVLLVNDNPLDAKTIIEQLTALGCCCKTTWGEQETIVSLRKAADSGHPFDLLIIDDLGSGMVDGENLGRRIGTEPSLCHTKMIMLTTHGFRGDAARLHKIGFSAYLLKPLNQKDLYDSLRMILAKEGDTVPVAVANKGLVTRHSINETRKENIRILIVEDNPTNQKVAQYVIRKLGYHADAVSDGRQAVITLAGARYDLVFMDVQMPEMDGYTATAKIREKETHDGTRLPIVAMTANTMKGDREKCLEAGMDDYIAKPINPEMVLEKIRQWTDLKHMDDGHLN